MSVIDEYRGPPPEVKAGTKALIATPQSVQDIAKLGFEPEGDLVVIMETLTSEGFDSGVFRNGFLIYYQNPEGTGRSGYETRHIGPGGVIGGRSYEDQEASLRDLKHMGAVCADTEESPKRLPVLVQAELYEAVAQSLGDVGFDVRKQKPELN